jgi:putative transposase
VLLSRWFNWRDALILVKPRTLVAWHRKGFRLFWRRKSEAGLRPIPIELQHLIQRMAGAREYLVGEERIANELLLKLRLRVSPGTVCKYMPKLPAAPPGGPCGDQRWAVFLRNHAQGIVASEFCIAVTTTFRILYMLVVMEHASRRLIHLNATANPTATRTLQQLRESIPSDHQYRFIIHDHDAIFSAELNASLTRLGLKVITTPRRSPQANSLCERLVGSLRRECLDWIIPLSERHLMRVLLSWMVHYNRGRPHSSLGPGVPEQHSAFPHWQRHRHRFDLPVSIAARPSPEQTSPRIRVHRWCRLSVADFLRTTGRRILAENSQSSAKVSRDQRARDLTAKVVYARNRSTVGVKIGAEGGT